MLDRPSAGWPGSTSALGPTIEFSVTTAPRVIGIRCKIGELECRGVAQPGSAPALGEQPPVPLALSTLRAFLCFQQFGESAFAQGTTPMTATQVVLAQFWDRDDQSVSRKLGIDNGPLGFCLQEALPECYAWLVEVVRLRQQDRDDARQIRRGEPSRGTSRPSGSTARKAIAMHIPDTKPHFRLTTSTTRAIYDSGDA